MLEFWTSFLSLRLPTIQEGWQSQYQPGLAWWPSLLAGLLLLGPVLLVLRAWWLRDEYDVEALLKEEQQQDVHRALTAAEKRTVGEIVPVLLGRSDRFPAADLWAGILFALCGYFAAWASPLAQGALSFLLITLIAGIFGWFCSRKLPALRRLFVAPWRLQEMAEEQAFQEFYRHDLHRTEAATGVLLFVSLFERRVVVLGDEGIDEVMEEGAWDQVHQSLLQAIREDRLPEGLVAAVEQIGETLAESFPWKEGDRNEVPDRLIVRNH